MKSFALLFVTALWLTTAVGQTNTWTGGNSSWNTAGNWSLGVVPTAAHDVVINTGSSIQVDVTPPNLRSLTITNNSAVTFTCSGASRTITFANTGTGFSINSGSSLSLVGINSGGGRSMNIAFASATVTSSIAGTLTLNAAGGGSSYNASNSNTSVTGIIINNGGTITSTAGNLTFASGGSYTHEVNGSAIPTATWNNASTCTITGITSTTPSGLTQAFGHFTWDCSGHTGLINLNSALTTINGNFTVKNAGQYNSGNGRTQNGLVLSSTTNLTLNIGGNFNIEQSSTQASWLLLTNGTANVTMNVTGDFNMSRAGSGPVYFDCYFGTTLNTIVLNITGNYNQTGGWFDWAFQSSASGSNYVTMNLAGNYTHTGSSVMTSSTTDGGTPNGKIIFTGNGTRTFSAAIPGNIAYTNYEVSAATTLDVLSNINLTSQSTPAVWGGQLEVIAGGTIDLNTYQIVSSSGATAGQNNAFILNAGAKVITANNNGLQNTTIGSVSSSIATRTYSSCADYEFQGNATGTFTTTPTTATARDIIINNTSSDVVFNQSMAVSRTFNFQNGRANIGAYILTINSTATISGSSSSRYVITVPASATDGRLRQNGLSTSSRVFPIGTSSYYLPATITPSSAGSDFSLNVYRSTTTNGLPGGSAYSSRAFQADAMYRIDRASGSSDAQIRLDWQTNAIEGAAFTILSAIDIGIWVRKSNWVLAAGSGSANYLTNNLLNYASTSGTISDFGTPGTGYPYIVANILLLPIQFTLLKATKTPANQALLEWRINDHNTIALFEIEESSNGRKFTSIGKRTATEALDYSFTDDHLNNGTNYYRIKAVDTEGRITYSFIVAVTTKRSFPFQVFGNPVGSQLVFQHPESVNALYRITDASGRMVTQGQIPANAVLTQVDVNKLSAGNYILQFINNKESFTQTFMKQ
ncbi:MAG: T9SS type A sorting domain-containing protein [Chitinophagaceae bacterium]|nr:T9SS type A sorting domain-containing protein [Chitinophagaceae bacterium]